MYKVGSTATKLFSKNYYLFQVALRWILKKNLNEDQKEAIKAIVAKSSKSAPLLICGAFGTGKTYTLSQAVRQLVLDTNNRVLICTHTNTAADLHVKLLDDYLKEENGIQACRPLRLCAPIRRVQTIPRELWEYCVMKDNAFVLPTQEEIIKHRVIVTTLSMSRALYDKGFHREFFTHILIDEAAQALEQETLMPLTLAGSTTKVVFTGDQMQV